MSGLLFLFLTKRKSGWGICGSSWCLVWFLVCCDLPALLDLLGPCTNVVLTAYAHVRTEPQCDIGHTRGKKNSEAGGVKQASGRELTKLNQTKAGREGTYVMRRVVCSRKCSLSDLRVVVQLGQIRH